MRDTELIALLTERLTNLQGLILDRDKKIEGLERIIDAYRAGVHGRRVHPIDDGD